MEGFNIESDVTIDQYNLYQECLTMAATYHSYADVLADAESLVSEKKDNLKVILAETNISIREKCEIEKRKVTEALVAAMIDVDPRVIAARKELREAEATQLKLNAAVSALQIKKGELDNLVKRSCSDNYMNTPAKATSDYQTEFDSERTRKTLNPLPTSQK